MLKEKLCQWDGKSADDIGHIYQNECQSTDFVDGIILLTADKDCQDGATWLLKKHLEQGHMLSQQQQNQLYQQLPELTQWQSRLHLLQSLQYLAIPVAHQQRLELFIRKNLGHDNKFVRAWAYDGFFQLAKQYPEYRNELMEFLNLAMADEAASVKARVRNILKSSKS